MELRPKITKFKALVIFDSLNESQFSESQVSDSLKAGNDDVLFILWKMKLPAPEWLLNRQKSNCIITENHKTLWMHVGAFSSHPDRQILVFVNEAVDSDLDWPQDCVKVHPFFTLPKFQLQTSQFSSALLLKSEVESLHEILRKFIKHIASTPKATECLTLDKLLNIIDNLCKSHRNKSEKDISFLFVKAMFMDGLLENDATHQAFLCSEMKESQHLENLFTVRFSRNLKEIVLKIQQKVKEQKLLSVKDTANAQKESDKKENEPDQLKVAIQHVYTLYQSLFEKAEIFKIKKVSGVHRQVINYFNGYVKKMGGEKATDLEPHLNYVCANVLLALNLSHAFKVVGNQVEHDDKIIKTMELKMDQLCEDMAFINNIMSEPHKYLPYRGEPSQLIQPQIMISATPTQVQTQNQAKISNASKYIPDLYPKKDHQYEHLKQKMQKEVDINQDDHPQQQAIQQPKKVDKTNFQRHYNQQFITR